MTQQIGLETIPGIKVNPQGKIDPFEAISATNQIVRKLEEVIRLAQGARIHFGLNGKKTLDLSGNSVAELTIATGAITVTQSFHRVDTQGDAASDDLDTINGGDIGDIVILMAENDARDVVAKDGTGNLHLAGAADFTMDDSEDKLMLIKAESNEWHELSRSSNG